MQINCLAKCRKVFFLALGTTLLFNLSANSQPSLMADDIKDIIIPYKGQNEAYTLLRDAFNRSQWYYVPKQPRLTEIKIDGVDNPELTLIRYQFDDPTSPTGAAEGGLLQFAITLSPEGEALTALKNKLKEELDKLPGGAPQNLSLSALPIKKANAAIYKPSTNGDSSRLASNAFGGGTYPIFATQKAPFALRLSRWDADLNDALIGNSTTSNTGVPVSVTFTFQGVTPPAHLKVTANYSKLFHHYSEDKIFAAKASYFGLFGASTQIHWSTISESLRQNGELKVEKIGNDEIDEKNMDAVMQAVMKRINDNIFQVMAPPAAISPAAATAPSLSGYFGAAGYNASFKTVDQISTVDDVFEWTERRIVDRETLAGGYIGIGKYPENVRKRAVQFVPPFKWDLAHFSLPDMSELEGISQVTVNTELLNKQVSVAAKTATWKPLAGWQSIPGNRTITSLDFTIAPYINNGVKPEDLKFRTTTTVLQGGRNTTLVQSQDVFNGGVPIAPPVEGFKTIIFDPANLQFKALNDTNHLRHIDVVMTVGSRTFQQVVQPKLVNGTLQNPTQLKWVVKEDEIKSQPIKVFLQYDYDNGTQDLTIDDLLNDNHKSTHYFLKNIKKSN